MSVELIRKDKAMKFMREAMNKALEFSKDDSTRVGALILGRDSYEVRSCGYNGMPRGCDDSNPARLVRPEKYLWFEHAERNAIYNAARVGTALAGGILVSTFFPCQDCARAAVQSGLSGVLTVEPRGEAKDRWGESFARSMELLSECGLAVQLLRPEDVVESAPAFMRSTCQWYFIDNQRHDIPGVGVF